MKMILYMRFIYATEDRRVAGDRQVANWVWSHVAWLRVVDKIVIADMHIWDFVGSIFFVGPFSFNLSQNIKIYYLLSNI